MKRAALARTTVVPLAALLCGCGPPWSTTESTEGGFRVYMPTPTETIDVVLTDENSTFHYLGFKREARSNFHIPGYGYVPLSDPWVEAKSLDLRTIAPHLRPDADSRILDMPEAASLPPGPDRFKPFEIPACKGFELRLPRVRRRACIVGHRVFLLSMFGSEEELTGERARRFFESLEILAPSE